MKSSFVFRSVILSLALAAIGGALRAEGEAPAPAPAPAKPEVTERVLRKFDANKDGQLDETERAAWEADKKAHQEKQRAAMLEKYDLDKDGKINETEQAAMKADREKERAARAAAKAAAAATAAE
jgi:hypothetical protein